jgi:hypothetical protein
VEGRIFRVNLQALLDWFVERGYWGGEIIDDPAMHDEYRKTLHVHGRHISWKIYNSSPIPIYMGTAYMTRYVVKEISDVVEKVEEAYESYFNPRP